MPLTDTEVRRSKPGYKPYHKSDANSLFVWITPAGGKLWRWCYDFEGREKLRFLGRYPIVTLAEARERRDQARKLLTNGIDPMAKRKEEKAVERAQTDKYFLHEVMCPKVAALNLDVPKSKLEKQVQIQEARYGGEPEVVLIASR